MRRFAIGFAVVGLLDLSWAVVSVFGLDQELPWGAVILGVSAFVFAAAFWWLRRF